MMLVCSLSTSRRSVAPSLVLLTAVTMQAPVWSDPPASPSEQLKLAQRIASKAQRSEVWQDDAGNVIGLVLINHQVLDDDIGPRPGVSDRDLQELSELPHLEALTLEAQPVGDQGLETLKDRASFKQVGFHYMAKADGASAAPDFISVIDNMRELEILEIKHNFSMKSIAIEKLQGPFPNVWRLVLDTPITADQTLHIAELCSNAKDVQLHRSHVSPEQLGHLGQLMPSVRVLWFKPARAKLSVDHLAALKEFDQLEILSLQSFLHDLPFEKGWDALVDMPQLSRLEISSDIQRTNRDALDRLNERRPDLVIDAKYTRSRNYNGL